MRRAGPLFTLVAVAIVANAHLRPRIEGDTQVLLRGTVAAMVCLDDGECPCSGVAHFPALQYLELWRWLWTTPRKLEAVRKLLASIEGERL